MEEPLGLEYYRQHYRHVMPEMFAAVSDLYAEYWNDDFHFAWFDYPEQSWEDAFESTHHRYAVAVEAVQARRILDIACGRGGFAHYLAEHSSAEVLGIDLSPVQLAHAGRWEGERLSFALLDAMEVDTLPSGFDAAVCLDAACYFPDRGEFLGRLSRVLAPGARLLLVDWCAAEGLSGIQRELVLEPFQRGWGIAELETAGRYRALLEGAGFDVLEVSDLGSRVRRNWDFAYQRAIEAIVELPAELLPRVIRRSVALGPRGLRWIKEQFGAVLYLKAAFDAGFLRYVFVLAERAG